MSRTLADQMADLVNVAAEKLANSKHGDNRSIDKTPEWKAWCTAIKKYRHKTNISNDAFNELQRALTALDHPTFPILTKKGKT